MPSVQTARAKCASSRSWLGFPIKLQIAFKDACLRAFLQTFSAIVLISFWPIILSDRSNGPSSSSERERERDPNGRSTVFKLGTSEEGDLNYSSQSELFKKKKNIILRILTKRRNGNLSEQSESNSDQSHGSVLSLSDSVADIPLCPGSGQSRHPIRRPSSERESKRRVNHWVAWAAYSWAITSYFFNVFITVRHSSEWTGWPVPAGERRLAD